MEPGPVARCVALFAPVLLLLAAAGCGGHDAPGAGPSGAGTAGTLQKVSMEGTARFQDGTPVVDMPVQYRVTLSGTSLFAEGQNGCPRMDPHMEAVLDFVASTPGSGSFSIDQKVAAAKSAVNSSCLIAGARPEQLSSVRIDATILANEKTCPSYCAAQGAQGGASCVSDCETGSRVLMASKTLTRADLESLFQGDTSGILRLRNDLVFARLGPPISQGLGLDLVVDADAAASSIQITEETFSPDDCAIIEQCVGAPGQRKLLRFDGDIENLGAAPLELGDPENNPLFEYSACHNHYHLKDMMLYELIDPVTGQAVRASGSGVVGRKQGFCMMDMYAINASSQSGGYDCSNQGLSAGWEDSYDSTLDCQWLDITGVAPGKYTLRITVNPDGVFPEVNTSNNSTEIPVTIPSG